MSHPACKLEAWNSNSSSRTRSSAGRSPSTPLLARAERAALPHRARGHNYRIDRILDASIGEVEFDPPADDEIPEWFDLSEHARTFRVRMRAHALDSLPSPHQLGDQTDVGDGVVELDVTVHGDRRLEHMLVSLPADSEVLSPPEYAELRREHAARLLAAYR